MNLSSEIKDIQELWKFLFPENKLHFKKRQLDYLAFGSNYRDIKSSKNLEEEGAEKKVIEKKYKMYYIPKSDGTYRTIREPCDILKQIQRNVLDKILIPYSEGVFSDSCTGFRRGYSTVSNSKFHLDKEIVLKLDISDFFPSISQARVYGFFKKKFGFNHQISSYLSGLCTYKNELPQGAPTSPMIANIIGAHIDDRILKLIKVLNDGNPNLGMSYSRYADDLSLSYNDSVLNPNKLIHNIQVILEDEGFFMNIRKIRLLKKGGRKEVTGIIVNNTTTSIGRKRYKDFRAIIHSIKTLGWDGALGKWNAVHKRKLEKINDVEKFKQVIKGYHDYIYMIHKDGGVGERYLQDFHQLEY